MPRLAAAVAPTPDINAYFPALSVRLAGPARPQHRTLSCRIFGHDFELQADDTFNLWTTCSRCGCQIRQ